MPLISIDNVQQVLIKDCGAVKFGWVFKKLIFIMRRAGHHVGSSFIEAVQWCMRPRSHIDSPLSSIIKHGIDKSMPGKAVTSHRTPN
jgi:hypothetical protein